MQVAILPERRINDDAYAESPAGGWNPLLWLEAKEASFSEEWQQTGRVDIKADCSIEQFLKHLWLDTTTPSENKGLWAWFIGPNDVPVCVIMIVRTFSAEDNEVTIQCQTPQAFFDRFPGRLGSPVTYTTGSGSTLEEKPYLFTYEDLGTAFRDAAARVLANDVYLSSTGDIVARPSWTMAPLAIADTAQAAQLSEFYGIDYMAIEDIDEDIGFAIPAPAYLPPAEFLERLHSIAETRSGGISYSLVPVFVPPAAGIDDAEIGDGGQVLDYDGGPCFLWCILAEQEKAIAIGNIDRSAILQSDITVTDAISYVGNTAQFPNGLLPGRPGYAGPWMGITTGSADNASRERKRSRRVGKKVITESYTVINKGTLTIDALRLALSSPINIIDNDIDFQKLGVIPALGMKFSLLLSGGNKYTVVIDSLQYTYTQETGWSLVAPNQGAYKKRSYRINRLLERGGT